MLKLNVKENQLLTTKIMTKYTANDLKRIHVDLPTPGTNIAESGSYLLVLMSKFRVHIRVARLVD